MEEVITAPPTEGSPAETGLQPTAPISQEPAQPEKQGEVQVENPESQATSKQPERQRPPVSFYAKQRREQEERRVLKETVQKLNEKIDQFQKQSSVVPAKPEISKEEQFQRFWKEGPDYIERLLKEQQERYEQRLKDFEENGVPKILESRESMRSKEMQKQEAWDVLFPKSSPDSRETMQERVQKDPQRAQRLEEIIREQGLDDVAESDPLKVARIATRIYALENPSSPARNPLAPKKSQMASTSSGTPPGGGKMNTANGIVEKYQQMRERLNGDPSLLQNEQFKNEWDTLGVEMSKIVKGKS